MKSKTVVIAGVAVVVLVLIGAAALFVMPSGPRLEDVKHLLEPRIVTLPSQRVLVVEAEGDPTAMGSEAFGLLFKTYYRLKGVPKGPKQPAPCVPVAVVARYAERAMDRPVRDARAR